MPTRYWGLVQRAARKTLASPSEAQNKWTFCPMKPVPTIPTVAPSHRPGGYGARRALATSEIAVLIADKSDVFRMARGGRGPLFNLSDLRTDVRMDHG
jgi:hypothetical protein